MQILSSSVLCLLFTGRGLAASSLILVTAQELRIPGSIAGDLDVSWFQESLNCAMCHAAYDLGPRRACPPARLWTWHSPTRSKRTIAFRHAVSTTQRSNKPAPVVGEVYADGQFWNDTHFVLPVGTRSAKVAVYYQTVTCKDIEALNDGNYTDHWGETLYRL